MNWDELIIETRGEIRALKHLLNLTKGNLKASKERLKEFKQKKTSEVLQNGKT